jgi:hypothetical protein
VRPGGRADCLWAGRGACGCGVGGSGNAPAADDIELNVVVFLVDRQSAIDEENATHCGGGGSVAELAPTRTNKELDVIC